MEQRVRTVDVAIVGGGPAGLSAALVLGRACKKVLLLDSGPRRNARAEHLHGFVTRDGTPPAEFRGIAREQLTPYDVEILERRVTSLTPKDGGFELQLDDGTQVKARRVILAMGLVDEPLDLPGMSEAWGRSVFQCPHCHGWERRGLTWGVFIPSLPMVDYALMLTGWTPQVVAFTHETFDVPAEVSARLAARNVQLRTGPIRRLVTESEGQLRGIELSSGEVEPVDVLFMMPKQHLPPLVKSLGLALTDAGFVRVNEQQETSIPGLYAAGDLTTPMQAALVAAAGGAMASWMMIDGLNIHGGP